MPTVRNRAQASENARKNSSLNYKSAALPAERCRQKNAAHINARRRSNKLRTLETRARRD
jgi:hypothetical protein